MTRATPTTVSSALAVIASRTPVAATIRYSRLSKKRPTTITPRMVAMANKALRKSMPDSAAPKAKNGTSAISGMAARSWNSSTEKASLPWRLVSSPFSSST